MKNEKENIMKYIGKILDIIFMRKDNNKAELNNLFEELGKSISERQEKVEEKVDSSITKVLEYLENEVKESREKLSEKNDENLKLNHDIGNMQEAKNTLDDKLKKLKNDLTNEQEKNFDLENKYEELEKDLKSKSEELKESKEKVSELSQFKEVFLSDKTMNLLDTLLENPTLKEYREEKKIIGKDATSVLNLLLHLNNPKLFVGSYYKSLVEYKKEHQEEMSKEEVAFYESVNNYFDTEFILNPSKTKTDDKFDKKKHRGIGEESKGDIVDGIILIPSDDGANDRIKVKIK